MRIIHQETLIASSFGILDNEGNVIQTIRIPEPVRVGVLSPDHFAQAHKLIADYKVELQKQLDAKIAEESKKKEEEAKSDKSE